VIRGLSSRLLADLRLLEERCPDLWPGAVGSALQVWISYLRDLDPGVGCGVHKCCGNPLEARHLAKTAERHAA
jgi:hypothetical protein